MFFAIFIVQRSSCDEKEQEGYGESYGTIDDFKVKK